VITVGIRLGVVVVGRMGKQCSHVSFSMRSSIARIWRSICMHGRHDSGGVDGYSECERELMVGSMSMWVRVRMRMREGMRGKEVFAKLDGRTEECAMVRWMLVGDGRRGGGFKVRGRRGIEHWSVVTLLQEILKALSMHWIMLFVLNGNSVPIERVVRMSRNRAIARQGITSNWFLVDVCMRYPHGW